MVKNVVTKSDWQMYEHATNDYRSYPVPSSSGNTALSLTATTAGRVGFHIDYSDLTAAGDHTFLVGRTHGTAGAVSVQYQTSGDTHSTVSGTLNWADGEADIKVLTVPVTAGNLTSHSGKGHHRIRMTLSNPTGGVTLHHGTTHTKAYGIIDNSTMIASDANAVFVDYDAVSNGTGTQASPYNNWQDASSNVGSKRYIYKKGTLDVSNTTGDAVSWNSAQAQDKYGLIPPASRADEDSRLYIQEWPGETCIIQGAAGRTDTMGFCANNSAARSYHTIRNITVRNLDCTSTSPRANAGVMYRGSFVGITVEGCTFDNINGNENQGGVRFDSGDGAFVWRCTMNNVQNAGDNTNVNASAALIENASDVSIQRCEWSNLGRAVYHKKINTGDVPPDVRFCLGQDNIASYHVVYADTTAFPENAVVMCNVFKGDQTFGGPEGIDMDFAYSVDGDKAWIVGNVFYRLGFGTNRTVGLATGDNFILFNNIFHDCRTGWQHISTTGSEIEYGDYNNVYDAGHTTSEYRYKNVEYTTAALLNAANSNLAGNDLNTDPLFTNAGSNDFTRTGNPTDGLSSTQMGVYLTGNETIGAS